MFTPFLHLSFVLPTYPLLQIELDKLKYAKLYLLVAFNKCGEAKELRELESTLLDLSGLPVRPRAQDFEIIEELGTGNFTQIFKAVYIPSDRVYAIKVIEKANVEKMKRRHPNIHNEILMEKRSLNKLEHPNIVQLFSTYQDGSALYYQMEFCAGGEIWSAINEGRYAVGMHWSMAKFHMAEAINAIEYLHTRGIVHRDLKPENMMLAADGRLKLVDFGTAKDLIELDLNGQNFVGTAEYMCPRTIKSKSVAFEVDLWALGVVLHQLYLGFTPFSAPSPYLSFIRIKRATLRHTDFAPKEFRDFLEILLKKDDNERFAACTGGMALPPLPPTAPGEGRDPNNPYGEEVAPGGAVARKKPPKPRADDPELRHSLYRQISYDTLRSHPFFTAHNQQNASDCEGYTSLEAFKQIHLRPPERVPRLHELCIRAVGAAIVYAADTIANSGGIKPSADDPEKGWMAKLNMMKVAAQDRARVMHYLDRREVLHSPSIYRLFFSSLPDARCLRVDPSSLEYIGYNRQLQGHFKTNFFFVQIADPQFGMKADGPPETSNGSGGENWDFEYDHTKKAISAINKIRPRFVLCSGDQTNAWPDQPCYLPQVTAFRKAMCHLSETIPVLYVAGNHDLGDAPTMDTLTAYRKHFGPDYYGFWYNGIRCLVLNSCLFMSPEAIPDVTAAQDIWFEEEIEQAKLCAQQVLIFTHHPWFLTDVNEGEEAGNQYWVIPKPIREKWFKKLRHAKVTALFAGHYHRNVVSMPFPKKRRAGAVSADDIKLKDVNDSDSDNDDDKNKDHSDSEDSVDDYAETKNEVVNPMEAVDENYEGPEMITSNSVGMSLDQAQGAGIRIVKVTENAISHEYFEVDAIPTSVTL